MRITRIESIVVDSGIGSIPPSGAHTLPISLSSTVVKIHTDDGLVGLGESWFVYEKQTLLADLIRDGLAPLLQGEEANEIGRLWYKMWWPVKRSLGALRAMSAIDMALWDLKGKAAQLPLYEILGGLSGNPLTAYATTLQVDESYGDSLARLIPHGFRAAKMALGRGFEADQRLLLDAVDKVGGSLAIAVDANGAYDLPTALQLCKWLEPIGVLWFEEPVTHHDYRGLAELRSRTTVPIAGFQEESTIFRLRDYLAVDALSIYNPSLAVCGGVGVAWKIAVLTEAFQRRFIPHGFGPPVMYAATLHVAASSPNTHYLEFPVLDSSLPNPRALSWDLHILNSEDFMVREDGTITPPDLPGLGIVLDEDALEDSRLQ